MIILLNSDWIIKNKAAAEENVSEDVSDNKDNKELKDNLIEMLLSDIDSQIRVNSFNDGRFFQKETTEISKLDNYSIGSAEFKELMKLHDFNKNSVIKTIECLIKFNEISDEDVEDNTTIQSFLDAMRINRERFGKNEKNS